MYLRTYTVDVCLRIVVILGLSVHILGNHKGKVHTVLQRIIP
jgi:hypothetical protein